MSFWRRIGGIKKWLLVLILAAIVAAVSGCRTLGFYAQAIKGQYQLVWRQEPISKVAAEAQTPEKLRQRLQLVQGLREFASRNLKLPVDGHYEKYVDLHRPFVVWNVEATPEFSMEPKTWWYPLVGSLEYRGYFSKRGALSYAAALRKKGYDVFVGGATAYSTLGWFKDPVLNTFIFESEPDLAETIFHELGHQRVFARGDTDFNEAFATTVGQEGAKRWLRARKQTTELEDYLGELRRNDEFVRLVMKTRARLEALYGDERTGEGKVRATSKKSRVPREQLRLAKERILAQMRQGYSDLKQKWGGNTDYDPWFARALDNAQLNSIAAYYEFVPSFQHLLELNGGDLEKFYEAVERLSKMPKKQRHQWLRVLEAAPDNGETPVAKGGG